MPHKTERKLLKIGGSHAIIPPKEWLEYHDLKRDMEDKDNKELVMLSDSLLVVYPKGDKKAEAKALKLMEKSLEGKD
jgi:hypothetical protein